jgi:beta-lactamase regulating signal transducer with metallopeptidase domain
MNTVYYIIEANGYLALLYLAYRMFLRKSRFHVLNRYYLVLGSVLCFLLPLLNFSGRQLSSPALIPVGYSAMAHGVTAARSGFSYNELVLLVYFLGVSAAGSFLIHNIYKLHRMSRDGEQATAHGMKVIYIDDLRQPFSFFTSVFLPLNGPADAESITIRHEYMHVHGRHSLDMLLLEIMKVVSWFLPVVYVVQRELKLIHEYIVDSRIAGKNVDLDSYINNMMQYVRSGSEHSLQSGLSDKALLKNRIIMMYSEPAKPAGKWKYVLPFVFLGILPWASSFVYIKDYGISINKSKRTVQPHAGNWAAGQSSAYILPDTTRPGKKGKKKDSIVLKPLYVIADTAHADTVRDKNGKVLMIRQNLLLDTTRHQ